MDPATSPPAVSQDEINRLWQHGLHEERLFHDRLNYFSAVEMGLLSVFAILYNKDKPFELLLLLGIAAFAFTLLWLALQIRHWRYCLHVNSRLWEQVPEYRRTIESFPGPEKRGAFGFSKSLALGAPILFCHHVGLFHPVGGWRELLEFLKSRNEKHRTPFRFSNLHRICSYNSIAVNFASKGAVLCRYDRPELPSYYDPCFIQSMTDKLNELINALIRWEDSGVRGQRSPGSIAGVGQRKAHAVPLRGGGPLTPCLARASARRR